MQQEQRLLESRKRGAEMLSVSIRKIDEMLARGVIRGVKIGRRTLIPYSELARLAKNGCGKGAERK